MGDTTPSATPPPASVSIPEVGNISLATLDQVRAIRTQLAADAQNLDVKASSLENQAEQKFADAAAILVPRRSEANLSSVLAPDAEKAQKLVDQIASLNAQLQAREESPHSGLRAVFTKVGDWNEGRKLNAQRAASSSALRSILVSIGRNAGQTPIVEAQTLIDEAAELDRDASRIKGEAAETSARVSSYDQEIGLRQSSQEQMGFDALYTAAYLQTYGPPAVESPLELKKGEQAYLSVPATLSRNQTRTHFVGGSQGFSFPIGHTGIRYRVGSFHGQPISQQILTKVDSGSLVISNQRVAFIGTVKSVLIQLAKVVHVEVYKDAVAVFHEGRENPDFFLVQAPKQVTFYINWALNKLRA